MTTHLKQTEDALSAWKMPKAFLNLGWIGGSRYPSTIWSLERLIIVLMNHLKKQRSWWRMGASTMVNISHCISQWIIQTKICRENSKGWLWFCGSEVLGTCQRCLHLVKISSANLEQFVAKVALWTKFYRTVLGLSQKYLQDLPPSSCKDDLKTNTLWALESILLPMMRKFVTWSCCFMDAYDHGLNGRQAAWAACKYRGRALLRWLIICVYIFRSRRTHLLWHAVGTCCWILELLNIKSPDKCEISQECEGIYY